MPTQISVEALSLITHNQIPVITTELLAQLYDTDPVRIRQNYSRNEDRFVVGKHYFLLEGDELRELKHRVSQSYSVKIARNVRSLILWTERGAARHAKMLETDQAWDVFEKLEDCYFSQKRPSEKQESVIEGDSRTVVIRFDEQGNVKFTQEVPNNAVVCTVERFRFYLEEHGWIVAHKGQLVEKLMRL
ncbi:ORF6N domain-containing protein [Salmonella enterica subsp. enterica serovar Give]|uniref:ORF6N domain-containing protein n=1 Tax=Salmonella enterica subsp. enterica serovar Give TaxID=46626 RepID=A0A8E7KCI5_SALET|nr:ORF6N domain-containing protein [Salmonella enterica]ECW5651865.1 ORF6N domain-containing protein [Salmonella enterica subsp. enterica serovar Newport]EBA1772976.1 ORF6N domain-containing protein [Salmonella enterica]EBA4470559.1 ORF6N domain-containing protein [Salmonella enterica]EBB3884080.1 ORF6N domain-containing protein [Salmonella enterica]EBL6585252.1 ORF6N domain-containing protein [Salmonella enterica subsp. enterica serovar Give]